MQSYRAQHEVRVLDRSADKEDFRTALAIYVRSTSPSLRTQTAQIQAKFERPDNPHGDMFYVSLLEERTVVGFVMFGYYPRTRLVVIDYMAIDEAHRERGSFGVFAALLQDCITERCPDYDYVVAEIATDPEFVGDGVNGQLLVRLLRRIGFGEILVRYDLPALDAKAYRKPHVGTLMVRGAQTVSEIRRETLMDLHQTILFEHYLPWFKDFLGPDAAAYRKQLERLRDELRGRLKAKPVVGVNRGERDELGPRVKRGSNKVLGVERAVLGHVAVFLVLLLSIALFQAVARLDGKGLAMSMLAAAFAYAALAAQAGVTGFKVFDRFGTIIAKLFSRR